jgi:cysteinyl-tRNA synthetase
LDLCFPHHENERAQAVAWGKQFATHWFHHGFIEMGGEKMSKSLGNFTTLTDLLDETDPRAYRLLVLRSHYRAPMEVTRETIKDAESAMQRLDAFARRFSGVTDEADPEYLEPFASRMDDDLDTPRAVAHIFSMVRSANESALDDIEDARRDAAAVFAMTRVLGLELKSETDELDDETRSVMQQRDEARAVKDWAAADALRDELQKMGWTVEDAADGTRVHR